MYEKKTPQSPGSGGKAHRTFKKTWAETCPETHLLETKPFQLLLHIRIGPQQQTLHEVLLKLFMESHSRLGWGPQARFRTRNTC